MKGLLFILLVLLASGFSHADEVSVAVASNFSAAMSEIVTEFEKSSEHKVKLSSGSSGKFYAQIKHGAPFQVFFSADSAKPTALEHDGLAVPGSRFTYAIGTLALWSAESNLVDHEGLILGTGSFNKVALANPRLAPYGIAAVEVLTALDLKDTTQSKWVLGENISQTYQFVATGNADIGFVALSQITHKGQLTNGSAWIIPDTLYSPVQQDVVLLRRGENSDAARSLLDFVRSERAENIINAYGYKTAQPPPSDLYRPTK